MIKLTQKETENLNRPIAIDKAVEVDKVTRDVREFSSQPPIPAQDEAVVQCMAGLVAGLLSVPTSPH